MELLPIRAGAVPYGLAGFGELSPHIELPFPDLIQRRCLLQLDSPCFVNTHGRPALSEHKHSGEWIVGGSDREGNGRKKREEKLWSKCKINE